MNSKILLLHGEYAYLCTGTDDTKFIVNSSPQANGGFCKGINYVISGSVLVRNIDTGSIVGEYDKGSLFDTGAEGANLQLYFIGNVEWLCLTKRDSSISITNLKKDEAVTIPNKTNLTLVKGAVIANSKTFNAVTPLRVRSADVVVTATEEATLIINAS